MIQIPLGQTPSQTVGPYFSMALAKPGENQLATDATLGRRIRIEGQVFDGDRKPIEDALIELWQANAAGRYRHPLDGRTEVPLDPAFSGAGRATTEASTGLWSFETVKPGGVPHPSGEMQAPHVVLIVAARGMLMPSFTRMYFAEDANAHAHDRVLQSIPVARRATLIATAHGDSTYRFDIRFQGDDETVFFDL
jgi:protocatechuate 3,4-dioxygenase, alpha subunit